MYAAFSATSAPSSYSAAAAALPCGYPTSALHCHSLNCPYCCLVLPGSQAGLHSDFLPDFYSGFHADFYSEFLSEFLSDYHAEQDCGFQMPACFQRFPSAACRPGLAVMPGSSPHPVSELFAGFAPHPAWNSLSD